MPTLLSLPPTTMVGSMPASSKMPASRDVVVVLPWEPATATPCFIRISSASISARGITGIPRFLAAMTSGLSSLTAEDRTTTCAPSTFEASWPFCTVTPSSTSRWVVALLRRSLPLTS